MPSAWSAEGLWSVPCSKDADTPPVLQAITKIPDGRPAPNASRWSVSMCNRPHNPPELIGRACEPTWETRHCQGDTGRGGPVGLGRARFGAVGWRCLVASRVVAVLGPVPGCVGRGHGPAAPDRGARWGAAPPGQHRQSVAGGPHGHGDQPGHRSPAGQFRAGCQALRRDRGRLPAPARQPQRVVEKSTHYATQRWWRTLAATTMVDAQADLDRWCTRVADRRRRPKARLERLGSPADHRPMVASSRMLSD